MDEQKKEITEAVAARIKNLRRAKELSQEGLAFRAGINPAYFGQVERGLKCPTIDTLYKIAQALDMSLPELLRTDTLSNYTEDHSRRMKDLLARVPAEKMDQVLKVIEDMADLF